MNATPAAVREALESADADRVNAAIEAVEGLDAAASLDRFDALHAVCREYLDTGTGYQRQGAVRVMDAFGTLRIALDISDAADGPDGPTPPDPAVLEDGCRTCWAFFLDAVGDEDGRVRRSAVRGLKTLGTAARYSGAEAELIAARETLEETLATTEDDAIREHIEDAMRQI